MRRTLAAVLVLLALAGCSAEATSSTSPAATASASAAPLMPWRPIPDESRSLYLAQLYEVSPGLATNEERAVRHGEGVCLDVAQGKPPATVETNAAARFTGGDLTVDVAMARRIVPIVRKNLCPKL